MYIHDVVFHFDPHKYIGEIDSWVMQFDEIAGREFRAEVETHIREEYSTLGWIMHEIIEKAGFSIEKCATRDGFVTEYVCRKMD